MDQIPTRKIVKIMNVPEQVAFYVKAASRYLGISPNTLRKRTDLGLVKAKRDENGHRVYLLKDLDDYLSHLPDYYDGDSNMLNQLGRTGRKGKGGQV